MDTGETTIFHPSSKEKIMILNLRNMFLFLLQFNDFIFLSNLEVKPS